MMTEIFANTPTLSLGRWESGQSVTTSRGLNYHYETVCWYLSSVFRCYLFSFSSITILYIYNFSWFCYVKIKWKMATSPWHWHNNHDKNFHLEKSGKKRSLGPNFVPMDSGCKKDCQNGWMGKSGIERKLRKFTESKRLSKTKCGRLLSQRGGMNPSVLTTNPFFLFFFFYNRVLFKNYLKFKIFTRA